MDYDHNRLDDGCTGELKVLIDIWYKMDSRVQQKAPQELLEVGRSRRGQKQRVNLRIGLYPRGSTN